MKTEALTERQRSERLLRNYVHGMTAEGVEEILATMEAEGTTFGGVNGTPATSVWHEVWRYQVRHDTRPRCTICLGRGRFADHGAHELCRARQEHGQPIVMLDDDLKCWCHECRPAGGR